MDRRGVASFLAITFGITYAVELALIAAGFRIRADGVPMIVGQYVIALVMWVPALATVFTTRWITGEGLAPASVRLGPWRPYLGTAVLVPAVFALIYAITWLLGLGAPDWQLGSLYALMARMGNDLSSAPSPAFLLVILAAASLFVAPFVNGIFGFGEELGWRGYLLPKLAGLGMPAAHLVLGVIWGLWHAPLVLVGFNYPGTPLLGVVAMCGLTCAFGVSLNVLRLRYRSSILAGWVHGLFNCQAYGVWRVLFPTVNPLLGGFTGIVGIGVWLVVGWLLARAGRSAAPS